MSAIKKEYLLNYSYDDYVLWGAYAEGIDFSLDVYAFTFDFSKIC